MSARIYILTILFKSHACWLQSIDRLSNQKRRVRAVRPALSLIHALILNIESTSLINC